MSGNDQISTAEAFDRHWRLRGLALLSLSLMYAVKATTHIVGTDVAGQLKYLMSGLALLAVALVIPVAYWKLRKLPKGERSFYFSPDGFVVETLNRAHKVSWGVTLFLLAGFEIFTNDRDFSTDLPTEFFLAVALAVMLGVLSLVFFFLNRADGDHEPENNSGA